MIRNTCRFYEINTWLDIIFLKFNRLWNEKENSKTLVLLLDYDGTLAVIQPNPGNTRMTPDTKKTLEEICDKNNVFVSIITGRCVKDIKEKVGIDSIIYAGNHGFEIMYPDGETHNQDISVEHAENYKSILAELEPVCKLLRLRIRKGLLHFLEIFVEKNR